MGSEVYDDYKPQTAEALVIEELALSEAELVERVTDLEIDNRALRTTLHEAVSMLYRTNVRLDRATRTIQHLHQALRDTREQAAA